MLLSVTAQQSAGLRLSARHNLSMLGAPVEILPRRTPKAGKETPDLKPSRLKSDQSYSEKTLDACSVSFDRWKPLP